MNWYDYDTESAEDEAMDTSWGDDGKKNYNDRKNKRQAWGEKSKKRDAEGPYAPGETIRSDDFIENGDAEDQDASKKDNARSKSSRPSRKTTKRSRTMAQARGTLTSGVPEEAKQPPKRKMYCEDFDVEPIFRNFNFKPRIPKGPPKEKKGKARAPPRSRRRPTPRPMSPSWPARAWSLRIIIKRIPMVHRKCVILQRRRNFGPCGIPGRMRTLRTSP